MNLCHQLVPNGTTEWPPASGRIIPKYERCTNTATRYIRVGPVVEYVCERCYRRDIDYPGTTPATESDYRAWIDAE